jgi:hypothetical protein
MRTFSNDKIVIPPASSLADERTNLQGIISALCEDSHKADYAQSSIM